MVQRDLAKKQAVNTIEDNSMDLKVRDVSKMLRVSESTVRRWLTEGKIPAYKLGNQYRFSPMEIEDWMMKRSASDYASQEEEQELPQQGRDQYNLFRAIHKGCVFSDLEGETKQDVIAYAMERLNLHLQLDQELMTELLLDREKMMPTALNHGIAVPHTRDIVLQQNQDIVGVAFLKEAIDWGALDGEPVHTLFFLFASDERRHLNLLAKIAHLSIHEEARKLFKARPNKMRLLQFIKDWEKHLL